MFSVFNTDSLSAFKMPHRYIKNEDHQWRCLPGEAHAKSLGLYYRLRTDTEIDWVLDFIILKSIYGSSDSFQLLVVTTEGK